jgi:DNA-binding NtrC family response regulator
MSASNPRPLVLVVDDEAKLREVVTAGLEKDFEVETASSADEAELMLATRHYDVIVCDHLMPGEEGVPFLVRMRKQFPQVQRILLTGYMNPDLISRSTEIAGLAACLMKPISAEKLIETIWFVLPR